MLNKSFQELWEIRFKKIFEAEKESFLFYKTLLEKHQNLLEGTKWKAVLEKIMKDEVRHARIAHELLRIVKHRKHVDAMKRKMKEAV